MMDIEEMAQTLKEQGLAMSDTDARALAEKFAEMDRIAVNGADSQTTEQALAFYANIVYLEEVRMEKQSAAFTNLPPAQKESAPTQSSCPRPLDIPAHTPPSHEATSIDLSDIFNVSNMGGPAQRS